MVGAGVASILDNVQTTVLVPGTGQDAAKAATEVFLLTEEMIANEKGVPPENFEPVVQEEPAQESSPEPAPTPPVPGEPEVDAECPQCQVVEMMAVLSLARTSCQLVEDQVERDECIAWSEALDPETIDNLDRIAEEVVNRAGTKGISKYAEVQNEVMRNAVIGFVQRKLDAGEHVDDDDLKIYKHMVIRGGA